MRLVSSEHGQELLRHIRGQEAETCINLLDQVCKPGHRDQSLPHHGLGFGKDWIQRTSIYDNLSYVNEIMREGKIVSKIIHSTQDRVGEDE